MQKPKKIIGILGGIGSGKSTVANEFEKLGCAVISADQLAAELLDDKKIKSAIIRTFGRDVLDEENNINRVKVSEIVFFSQKNVEKMNAILHPPILRQTNLLIDKYNQTEDIKAIILDMPLLVEVGWQNKCDYLIFVSSSEMEKNHRIRKNYPKNTENIKKREKFKISLDKKADIAHYIIDNNSDLKTLAEQVARIFSKILND